MSSEIPRFLTCPHSYSLDRVANPSLAYHTLPLSGALLFVQLLNNRRVKAELERVLARKKAKKRAAARAARMAKAEADVTWAQLSHLVEEEACDLDTAIVEGLPYGVIERQINFMLQKLQELRESGAGAGHGEHMERIVELLEKARQRARNPSA